MRNIIVLTFILFPILLLAQEGTTMDEYKYLTKGFAYQKEMGLDGSKAGYAVKPLFSASNGVGFQGLFSDENQKLKGVIVVMNQKDKSVYLGLPTNDSDAELKEMADEDVREKLNLKSKEKYDKALLEFAMFQLSGERVAVANTNTDRKTIKVTPPANQAVPEEYDVVQPLKTQESEKSETLTERSGMTAKSSVMPIQEKKDVPVVSNEINNKVDAEHNFVGRTFAKAPVVLSLIHI